jgi:hypothetical protein
MIGQRPLGNGKARTVTQCRPVVEIEDQEEQLIHKLLTSYSNSASSGSSFTVAGSLRRTNFKPAHRSSGEKYVRAGAEDRN